MKKERFMEQLRMFQFKIFSIYFFILSIVLIPSLVLSLTVNDFYRYSIGEKLPAGDENFQVLQLKTPVHFYTDTYDRIYINTNGILTFDVEFPNFQNIPFPLEYPAIAPFYSNVDTTGAAESTSISYFETSDRAALQKVTDVVRNAFSGASEFLATSLFVATWENVGRFSENNEDQNTFQVAIISNNEESYVQFLYPDNGLNWIQGDIGESGLPDVRSQVGFVAQDGRFHTLNGSATENVRFLNEISNYGTPGEWLFKVGPYDFDSSIQQPDVILETRKNLGPLTCSNGGQHKCHSSATCEDNEHGFCCICKIGFYGNGFSCLKDDTPIRVTGKVVGNLDGHELNSQLQSYVVMVDGRTYTALSPLTPDIGYDLQLLPIFGGVIGWLFGKPSGLAKNGYTITGGVFNHSTSIRFEENGEDLLIIQRFLGLNAWDQLTVDATLFGKIPNIPNGISVHIPDTTEEYNYIDETSLRSISKRLITVEDRMYTYTIDQQIEFERCPYSPIVNYNSPPFYNRISKVSASYQDREKALRLGMLNKISLDATANPCNDGTARCGENTVCVSVGEDYECTCKNGYTQGSLGDDNIENCVDIDECAGDNICDENAECYNQPGGYTCQCRPGFIIQDRRCHPIDLSLYLPSAESTTVDEVSTVEQNGNIQTNEDLPENPNVPSLAPQHWLCDLCSKDATCRDDGVCVCNPSYGGDGFVCKYLCEPGYTKWQGGECVLDETQDSNEDSEELTPFCYQDGCTCPTDYELYELADIKTCRPIHQEKPYEETQLPCDIDNHCSINATCQWVEVELRNRCVCNAGFEGDGFQCVEKEVSCLIENICDEHASCMYNEQIGKSVCKCETGYAGDGRYCHFVAECQVHEDCVLNSVCDSGVCVCQSGFERDSTDLCVPAGSCGGAYCAENAICQWDNVEKVAFCLCPEGFVGDGLRTCKSIPPSCNIRNNCGLYASCVPNYRNAALFECVCNVGYYGDGFICALEENCINVPQLCDLNAQCVSTTAGLQCVCNTGYIGNGSYCAQPPKLETGFLLLSQGIANVRIPFNGKRGKPVAMTSMAIGLDKDCSQGRLYWSDISTKKIMSSKYDGTDKQTFIFEDLISPEGVAVDWISRRLYWTDSEKDTIEVASLDNPKQRAVIVRKYLVNPRGITIDPHQNKLYWSDWNRDSPKIEWSNLDGTDRQVLLGAPDVQLPNSLSISLSTGELCFADAGRKKIDCINTYSKNVRNVASNLSYPFSLTSTEDKFFWTDWDTKKIESIDRNGNRIPGISSPLFGNHKMYGMTAVTDTCPLFFSQCLINNGDCPNERICLLNPLAPSGRSCKCINEVNCNDNNLDLSD